MAADSPNESLFLDPPHSHDPTNVSHVAALPTSLLSQLPVPMQDALWALQESTSVLYASYVRLQEMLAERFDRLVPLPGKAGAESIQYSEGAFFNYVNHLAAERQYLLEDALPDWKHKASRVRLEDYADMTVTFRGREMTVAEWYSRLTDTVGYWSYEAMAMELPDFEETVAEYRSLSTTPMSERSDVEPMLDQVPMLPDLKVGRLHRKYDSGIGMEIRKAMGMVV